MPIAIRTAVNSPGSTANVTVFDLVIPAGAVQVGDFMLWTLAANTATSAPTPTGWSIWDNNTTTGLNQSTFARYADATDAAGTTHTATGLTSARWGGAMVAYSGVDQTTAQDVAHPAALVGTTVLSFPAITPVTAGAHIVSCATITGPSGIQPGEVGWTIGNLDALDTDAGSNFAAAVNALLAHGHEDDWTSGAYTPTGPMDAVTTARTIGATWALRPAPASPAQGSASGAVSYTATATGASGHAGSAAGSASWAGTSSGARASSGAATSSVSYTGSATGQAPAIGPAEGSAAGTVDWSGTAAGTTIRAGQAAGAVGWSASAAGAHSSDGVAAGSVDLIGSAVGGAEHAGTAVGTIAWEGTAVGGSVSPAPVINDPRVELAPNLTAAVLADNPAGATLLGNPSAVALADNLAAAALAPNAVAAILTPVTTAAEWRPGVSKLKQNDTAPSAVATLTDGGTPVDLTGATVKMAMALKGQPTKVFGDCVIVAPATDGKVRYDWTGTDTDTIGSYQVEFQVTWADTTVQTFPPDTYLTLTISKEIDTSG